MPVTRPGDWLDPASGMGLGLDRRPTRNVQHDHRDRPLHLTRIRSARAGSDLDAGLASRWPRRRAARARRLEGVPDLRPVLHHRAGQGRQASAASSMPAGTAAMCCAPARPGTPSAASSASTTCGPMTWRQPQGHPARRPGRPDRQGREPTADRGAGRHLRRLHLPQPRSQRRAAGGVHRRRGCGPPGALPPRGDGHRDGCARGHRLQLESRDGRLRGGLPHQRHPSAVAPGDHDRPHHQPLRVLREPQCRDGAVRGRRVAELRRNRSTASWRCRRPSRRRWRCCPRFQELVAGYRDEDGDTGLPGRRHRPRPAADRPPATR